MSRAFDSKVLLERPASVKMLRTGWMETEQMPEWVDGASYHVSMDGAPITVKLSVDGHHALIARGHLSDIQPATDHVHVWNLDSGDFHLHDMRVSRSLFPFLRDEERNRMSPSEIAMFDSLLAQARSLANVPVDRKVLDSARQLQREWKELGQSAPGQYRAFRSCIDEVFARNRERIEARSRDWASNKAAKERLVAQAETAALSSDLRAAGDKMRALGEDWKKVGPCEKSDNDRLWQRFGAAREKLRRRKDEEFNKRKLQWASNKAAKERLVAQAETAALSSDLRAAGDKMRALGEDWKKVGPCEKSDNDRLWQRFGAAREKLRRRKDEEFNKRKLQWASNKAAKERLVSQMQALVHMTDFRAAKDQARALSDAWRATGQCEKADSDRLWQDFKRAKDGLFEAAKRAGDQRRLEARQRAQERVSRLEDQLSNVERQIYRADEAYSRALGARSPSMRNPNWHSIVQSQQLRQSQARERRTSLGQRKSEIINRLMEARSRLSQF